MAVCLQHDGLEIDPEMAQIYGQIQGKRGSFVSRKECLNLSHFASWKGQ